MTDDALAARLLAIFTEELDEQLRELERELLVLERVPGDVERLGAVFRVMHTLKGASRAAGLPQVEALCHSIEAELGRARDQQIALTGGQLALLFESADALGDVRDRLRRGERGQSDQIDVVMRHVREKRPEAGESPANATPPLPVPVPQPDRITARDSEALRLEVVRVSVAQVDAIAGAVGEVAGLAGALTERSDNLASLRASVRAIVADGGDGDVRRSLDREITALLRRLREDARALASVSGRLGASARRLRQRPVNDLVESVPRLIRDLANELGRQVRLEMSGGEIEADRVVLEALRDPLMHLVRNAVDHGVAPSAERLAQGKSPEGTVRIRAELRGDRLRLTVADDGAGLDLDAIAQRLASQGRPVPESPELVGRTILDDGFTTRDVATTVSGRGVGLGVARAVAERMGGSVEVESKAGHGVAITIDVPLSVATMRVMLVRAGSSILGIPTSAVSRVLRVSPSDIVRVDQRAMVSVTGAPAPVRTLASILGPPYADEQRSGAMQAVVVENAGRRLVAVVDDLVDERELVLRPVENAGTSASWSVGSALLGSGEVALVLNASMLVNDGKDSSGSSSLSSSRQQARKVRILVADDSMTSRTLEASVLTAAGYDVTTASDGAAAWRLVDRDAFDLVVSDVEMPHMDGFTLCERIRANARTARLPVVLVTSLDTNEQKARGLAVGADAYITKSGFDQDTLLDTVRMLVGREGGDSE